MKKFYRRDEIYAFCKNAASLQKRAFCFDRRRNLVIFAARNFIFCDERNLNFCGVKFHSAKLSSVGFHDAEFYLLKFYPSCRHTEKTHEAKLYGSREFRRSHHCGEKLYETCGNYAEFHGSHYSEMKFCGLGHLGTKSHSLHHIKRIKAKFSEPYRCKEISDALQHRKIMNLNCTSQNFKLWNFAHSNLQGFTAQNSKPRNLALQNSKSQNFASRNFKSQNFARAKSVIFDV
ncbi:hypothetical protein [Campylobacter gracilis]|uniref:Pentapeptide repeat-containing protein n=1 Tax=Campylobacter gracilis RM3268 TaxID=553220 RepID=C8PE31_9BACT|nr:hypothetical protein [Campylobacter gracilis]AKT92777.1 hypothetical protein CGRAC_1334 [Campylobacter gracilis]EEV18904.1 hypothetical protein CAMGR0001_2381 [Campylobacter gracilis RM3268]UEB45050.1 hypothetical protein LK410_08610 [Campylobacter gracilis]SUW82294.1 Uncharacterised protein [Campylobacter gracilis]